MRPAFILHPQADEELRSSMAWYEEKREGLGAAFLNEVDSCLHRIEEYPDAFPIAVGQARRATLHRFTSYSIIYEKISDNVFYVYSVFHGHRDPNVWQDRLNE